MMDILHIARAEHGDFRMVATAHRYAGVMVSLDKIGGVYLSTGLQLPTTTAREMAAALIAAADAVDAATMGRAA